MFARTSQCACPFFLGRQLPTCVCGAQIFRMTGLISVKPAKGTHGAANDIKEIYCSHGRQYGKCHTCDAYYDRAVIGYFRHRKELKSPQVCKQAYTERSECDGHCSYCRLQRIQHHTKYAKEKIDHTEPDDRGKIFSFLLFRRYGNILYGY